jgi:hypothetical protein
VGAGSLTTGTITAMMGTTVVIGGEAGIGETTRDITNPSFIEI